MLVLEPGDDDAGRDDSVLIVVELGGLVLLGDCVEGKTLDESIDVDSVD